MSSRCVLVVEDDSDIRRGLADSLRFAGFEVLQAGDGERGLAEALRADLDLLVLDLILPGLSGYELLKAVRSARPTLPVILLTARGEEDDRIRGLELGADDYVTKPFSVRELLARVEAVLRRSPERPSPIQNLHLPQGVVDFSRSEIRFNDGGRADLSEKEAELLRYLAANPSRTVSREEILLRVWRLNPRRIATRTIDMHIANLRNKIRDDDGMPGVLMTVRGKGYQIRLPSSP